MKKFLQSKIFRIAGYVELFVTFILIIAIAVLSVQFMLGIFNPDVYKGTYSTDVMNEFLAQAFSLAVGVEFVKMLSKHTPSTVIEVLLFATARQIVVLHNDALATFMGVITIASLFAIRKYLFCGFDETERVILRASLKVKIANIISHVHLPEDDEETLREVVIRMLEDKKITIATGAVAYYDHDGLALRIAKMSHGKITRVEVIRSV
ncbi:MAG: transporter [Velocimicrobium sp.]